MVVSLTCAVMTLCLSLSPRLFAVSNPKAMALMQKAQSNPKIMKALQDVQTNGPSAMQKYAGDPEIMSVIKELQEIMK